MVFVWTQPVGPCVRIAVTVVIQEGCVEIERAPVSAITHVKTTKFVQIILSSDHNAPAQTAIKVKKLLDHNYLFKKFANI